MTQLLPTSSIPAFDYPLLTAEIVRKRFYDREETALIDVREEHHYAQEHPLWASNFPLSTLELKTWPRIPRRDTIIVLYGQDESGDLAPRAATVFARLGYTRIYLLQGGLAGWKAAGGEVFRDVNVPSKAFGELVEAKRHTPSLAANEVQDLIDQKADIVVLDERRYDEYQTMNIPGSISVPGAELVLRARALAPSKDTRIIVNCAGRTRSIIGTQSLVNAGIPNPVAALRNGTIGWTLAGQTLEHGADRQFASLDKDTLQTAQTDARNVADKAGVHRISYDNLHILRTPERTTYFLDVRTAEEYITAHLPGFAHAPGGQLVQETDHTAPVRGARLVLADNLAVRANMTASWLAQMGWEVHVVDDLKQEHFSETGASTALAPPEPVVPEMDAQHLYQLITQHQKDGTLEQLVILDFTTGANYTKRHVPGARFALRSQLSRIVATLANTSVRHFIFTCNSSQLARFAAHDARQLTDIPIDVLTGGTLAWIAADLPLEHGTTQLACPLIDRYRRPYEGTDAPTEAMQAYLDWEFGLVEQLRYDGTHHFTVI